MLKREPSYSPDAKAAPMTDNIPSQSDKFKDAARELECDENEAAFEEKLKKIAKTEPAKNTEDGDK